MTVRRREVLATFGVASASTLLWALGCGAPTQTVRRAPQVSGEVRTWLRDAVARIAVIHPTVHALAVSRRRTTVARDVLGAGVARSRSDGVVFTVRGRDGAWREHVTSELSEAGVDAAAIALGASRARKHMEFGPAPTTPVEPPRVDDRDLRHRVERLLHADASLSRRIVYAAALLDVDDATVWSVAPGRDLEQRLVRIRQRATRAAWNGRRPVVRELERAWSGWLDDHPLTDDEIAATSEAVLEQMTPGAFEDGPRSVVLDPSVVALILDTVARRLLTSRGGVAGGPRLLDGAPLASSLVTLVDDPTVAGAYGQFAFDDEGEPAAPITLIDGGRIAARLADHAGGGAGRGRRPGHLARVEPSSSHLVLTPGSVTTAELYGDGLVLEAGLQAVLDPAGDRIRISCGRARELKAGNPTGRVYPDVELIGSLTELLSAVDAIAHDPISFAGDSLRGASGPDPLWSSIAAPALRTRGFVRARRSAQ